jgi:ferredoxin--NADP+ reductase
MAELNAVVSQRVEVSPYTIILRIVPDGWGLPEFTPGQFTVLGLPCSAPRCRFSDPEETGSGPDKLIKRAYSIASSSVEREYIEFYITLVRSGALTPRLFALGIGDRVWLSPKFTGTFTLAQIPKGSNVVLVATGTGLAPYMSMLRTELGHTGERKFAVLHGATHSWDLGYRSELITMQRICPGFKYLSSISCAEDEPVPWNGPVGFVQNLWRKGALEAAWGFKPTPENTHILLCGNPNMVETMIGLLAENGFNEQTKDSPGTVHLERFW